MPTVVTYLVSPLRCTYSDVIDETLVEPSSLQISLIFGILQSPNCCSAERAWRTTEVLQIFKTGTSLGATGKNIWVCFFRAKIIAARRRGGNLRCWNFLSPNKLTTHTFDISETGIHAGFPQWYQVKIITVRPSLAMFGIMAKLLPEIRRMSFKDISSPFYEPRLNASLKNPDEPAEKYFGTISILSAKCMT